MIFIVILSPLFPRDLLPKHLDYLSGLAAYLLEPLHDKPLVPESERLHLLDEASLHLRLRLRDLPVRVLHEEVHVAHLLPQLLLLVRRHQQVPVRLPDLARGRDQVRVFRNDIALFLVVGLVTQLVDLAEGVGDDGHQQIHHDDHVQHTAQVEQGPAVEWG